MAEDTDRDDRQRVLDRANRMLNQSRTLRKLADELRDESAVIRQAAKSLPRKKRRGKKDD
jgi:hypothetical protein